MTDRARRLAPALLVVALALALLPTADFLRLEGTSTAAEEVTDVLDALPADGLVLVGFDADLGTYAEIRPTVRALLADLLARDARLAFVSLTPEGRALAIAERSRLLASGVEQERLADAGFIPGGEAALVRVAGAIGAAPRGPLVGELPGQAVALGLVVGGNDLGPRSWVEQVAPRVDGLDLVAVAPTVLLPELRPYLESGQLSALLATPRDGAAYRASVETTDPADVAGPGPLAILVGMVVAIGVLGTAVVSRLGEILRSTRGHEAA
jgi:hypothetical protein